MASPTLAIVILAVKDLATMSAFYRALLGWRQVVDAPVYVELQHDDGMRLGLYVDEHFARNVGELPAASRGLTRTELYLHCVDLDEAIERAHRIGARTLGARAPRAWGDEAAYVADPEGNVVVLARPAASG